MCLSGEWVSNGSLTALISEVNKSREAELAAKKKTKLVIKHDDLKKGAVLGEGSFGVVCIASYDGKAYALKALHKGHLISTNQVKNTINEKNIMQQVRGEPRSHSRTATATEPHTRSQSLSCALAADAFFCRFCFALAFAVLPSTHPAVLRDLQREDAHQAIARPRVRR